MGTLHTNGTLLVGTLGVATLRVHLFGVSAVVGVAALALYLPGRGFPAPVPDLTLQTDI